MKKAYSLLELSIVLVIMGFIAFTFTAVIDSFLKVNRFKTSFQRLDLVESSLLRFLNENRGLPCPAGHDLSSNDTGFGEDGDSCDASSVTEVCADAEAYEVAGVVVGYKGSIPAITLDLPTEYMYDGFDRRFTYFVSSDLICKNGVDINSGFYSNEDNLPIVYNKPNTSTSVYEYQKNAYVIVSHGKNGFGAYTKSGEKISTDSASSDEIENSDSDNEFVYNYFRPESMDDILRFKNKWQLMNDLEELDSTKRYPSEECNCSTGIDKFNDMCL